MTAAPIAETFAAPVRTDAWRRHGTVLALVATVLLLLCRRDVADLARIWWTSTTYGHCLFIAPVIAWLVWQRRAELAQLRPVAWVPGLALVGLGGVAWLVGDAAGVALARHLGLVVLLQGATVTLLGPRIARGLLFPLAYALFLVPFGEEFEAPLQAVTVAEVMPLLHLFGVPATSDGVLIHAGRYWFEVAEACSGAKFVIAMIAFATLVANQCFHSWRRRFVFVAVSLIVPILANGVRAFGTIYAAHVTSVEAATGADHIVYGWVFFGLVMAAVLALGWRWFDRAPDDPAFDPARLAGLPAHRIAVLPAAVLVLALAALFPAWSATLASQVQPLPDRLALPDVPGWRRAPLSTGAAWQPFYPNADHYLVGRYVDGSGAAVDMAVAVFADQHEGAELIAFGTGVLRENDVWVRVADLPPLAGGRGVRITAPGPVERSVYSWYRVGNVLTASDRRVKLETLRTRLLGGPRRAVALHLSVEGRDPAPVARFVAALGPLDRAVDGIVAIR